MQSTILKYTFVIICVTAFVSSQTFNSAWGPDIQMSCSDSFSTLISNGVTNLTLPNTRYFFGYTLVPGQNQNPCVARFDSQKQTWCRCDYETTAAFGSAYGGMYDGDINSLFVVFNTDGSAQDNYSRYTTAGWIKSYGTPNLNEVAIVLELDKTNGTPTGLGTYIEAIDSFGGVEYAHLIYWQKEKVSTMTITLAAGQFPLNFDLTPQTCSDIVNQPTSLYTWKLELPLTLSFAFSSQADGCTSKIALPSTSPSGSHSRSSSITPTVTPSKGSPPSNSPSRTSSSVPTNNPSNNPSGNPSHTQKASKHNNSYYSNRHSSSASTLICSLFLLIATVALLV